LKALNIAFLLTLLLSALLIAPFYLPEKADIVIIGAGAAGMSAALEADRENRDVILLEKMPYPGGNTYRATAGINAALDEQDIPLYIEETLSSGRRTGSKELVTLIAEKSLETLQWLADLGADLSDRGRLAGHSAKRSRRPSGGAPVGREVVSTLYAGVREKELELRTENRALSVTLQGRHLDVLVESPTGREYTLRTRAVIIASGGFGGSPELFTLYNPRLKGFNTTNSPGATGDYLELTRTLPVQLIHLDDIQTHPTVEPDFGILITEALRGNGGILLNSRGKRFTDEMAFRDTLSREILRQPGGSCWLIFDESIREGLTAADFYLRQDLVRQGDSWEELAGRLEIEPSILKNSITRWNGSVTLEKDRDYQRRDLPGRLDQPPFYAIKVAPGVHYCMGGLAIDRSARVLDGNGQPIPGLYAAGEATGGIHGKDRLGGNSLIDALVFGRIAGRAALEYTGYPEK